MQNLKIKIQTFKFLWVFLPLVFIILNFTGCATIPMPEALPTYNLNGVSYLSLVRLCQARNINFDYDTFTRSATLTKDAHRISLMVGDAMVLVDGKPTYLRSPVDIYEGVVMVPYRFKEDIVDSLFKAYPPGKQVLPALKIKRIVLDPGHGGNDPGAIGRTGLREKDVTLDIAKRLAEILKSYGVEVVMTRSTDRFVSLAGRVEIANRSNADLFLSIHANANRVRGLNGFEVYYIGRRANDAQRALSSARSESLNLGGSSLAGSSLDLKATLWDMVYTNNRAASLDLAGDLCRAMERNLNAQILGIKEAGFYVLKGAHMPAVLAEVGFVSNGEEERQLRNDYYRQQIAQALEQGIVAYAQDLSLAEANRQ